MTGPGHYREAEHLIDVTLEYDDSDPRMATILGAARIHATLALAAATALGQFGDMPAGAADEWLAVLLPPDERKPRMHQALGACWCGRSHTARDAIKLNGGGS